MARPVLSRPTDGDIDILKVLWTHGPLTVRQVYEHMGPSRKGAMYNSILKRMQIMEQKGTIVRQGDARPMVFRAAAPQKTTQRQLIVDLVRRVFDGSTASLMLHALGAKKVSKDELADIQRMLDASRKNS